MKSIYAVLFFMIGSFAFPSKDTSFDIKKRETSYHYTMIEEAPYVAVVILRRAEKCGIKDKYCGATILSEYWVLSSAECFNSMYEYINMYCFPLRACDTLPYEQFSCNSDEDKKIDCVCPKRILVATKVDALPPDTDILTHEIKEIRLANNSISVHSENAVLIKLKTPIHFDEAQKSIPIGKAIDKPTDFDCVELTGFKLNRGNGIENLGSTSMSITNACYGRFPEIVNDCFCTIDYNYKVDSSDNISHFLPGTSVVFNNKLVGFDPNTVTFADTNSSTNVTYVILINTANIYKWIMETIKK